MKITFTNVSDVPISYQPKPALHCVPEWYKNLNSYIDESKKPMGKGETSATVKKCMPVFDAMTAGYILFLQVDVYVSRKDGQPWYEWPSLEPINFHPIEQAPNHPYNNAHSVSIPKWMNFFSIKTPKDYSCLFTQPFHRESVFTTLPGFVDTDRYDSPVNFPFVLNDANYEGLIPAGTPIVQIIPIKRESWNMKFGGKKELESQKNTITLVKSKFFDSYKTLFRQPKEYK